LWQVINLDLNSSLPVNHDQTVMSALFLESRDKNLAYRVDLSVFLETFADAQLAVFHVTLLDSEYC
jgi:hypothetical protein